MGKLVIIVSVLFLAALANATDSKRITIYPKERPMHIEVPQDDTDVMVDCSETRPGEGISRKEMRHLEYILQNKHFKNDPNLVE